MAGVTDAVAASPVVIADGHHRYQTARVFAAEATGPVAAGAGSVMALVVELTADQPAVGAFHRACCPACPTGWTSSTSSPRGST